ncbi:hypothetical protein MAPG_04658 [Magnaporthiopsis poae ATCC 64411]|uniref:Extragenic suppressor of kinetochore protein 1 n=1 Tax=Magnaporthiopsis poae (strain ATCC 64411 / 73-15) TaxID=644358 RepID=A0A0C4DXB7_MAGP6|nr:hypothetical protein MAPG_04658 [Magnaporthiopsis poae ATCC 64411]
MFWRFGSYASASAIDTILDKPEFTVEELLDESDLIQELKQHNVKLLEHLRRREVLDKLLDYAVAPKLEPVAVADKDQAEDGEKGKTLTFSFSRPRATSREAEGGSDADEAEKRRNKYAFVASEILSCENWSVCEAIMDIQNRDLLRSFWNFLQRPSPLDPLQASYFTKVNESLFDKKTQEMIEFLKSVDGAVPNMLRHVDSPMVMDLLLKIISLERTANGQGIVEWLYTKDVMPSLLSFLGPEHSWATQTSAGDFIKAIITVSANASQNEQTCIGPNELTRQLVSRPCIEQLIGYMLGGGNALTVGVGIVIEVIRKNNSDYDPDVGVEANSVPSSRDPIYLGTLLRLFAENVPKFMSLIMAGQGQKPHLESTFGGKIQPLGFDRFKTCELMAELLHCSNMGLLNEVGSEDLIAARDAERQRLRAQGSLTAVRGEEAPSSAEDLTMRIPGGSPADEVRRLEVTNISDDDGFEEVIGAAEMAEDTSHEFVKAEEEIQHALPTSSFLDKDEDDFVDEPLSSPRLNVSDTKMEDHQFEDPEMVVEPLSPRKQAMPDALLAEPTGTADPTSVTTAIKEIEELALGEDELAGSLDVASSDHVEKRSASPEAGSSPPSFTSTTFSASEAQSATTAETDSSSKTEPIAPAAVATSLEPHPDLAPAPLFSTPSKQPAEGAADVAPTATAPAADSDKPAVDAKGDAMVMDEPTNAGTIEGLKSQDTEGGEASGAAPAPATETQAASDDDKVTPVVGDFLKMQFVEHRVVPTILSFFFTYPWNNFLHNVVYDVVQQVFNGPMDRGYNPTLAISLFEAADITAQIINGQLASEESEAKNRTRMGYMGHLTLIAEEVVKFNERHPPELLSETVLEKVMSPEWSNYVEGALAETRERDNAILGGVRPEVAMNNRAAAQGSGLAAAGLSSLSSGLAGSHGSSALADAGLNGGLDLQENGGMAQFAISSGTVGGSSGFGSSSDEDDDEENDEDVNNEVSLPFHSGQISAPISFSRGQFVCSSSFYRHIGPEKNGEDSVASPDSRAWLRGLSGSRGQLSDDMFVDSDEDEDMEDVDGDKCVAHFYKGQWLSLPQSKVGDASAMEQALARMVLGRPLLRKGLSAQHERVFGGGGPYDDHEDSADDNTTLVTASEVGPVDHPSGLDLDRNDGANAPRTTGCGCDDQHIAHDEPDFASVGRCGQEHATAKENVQARTTSDDATGAPKRAARGPFARARSIGRSIFALDSISDHYTDRASHADGEEQS